ncbi:restriction endonuclease [Rivihabitans pingtungensis]|uniref:restriction endonuclease n=1 Tax=Rivihabitans pingtungensis TaxID=1054498 RepID=UPI0035711D41
MVHRRCVFLPARKPAQCTTLWSSKDTESFEKHIGVLFRNAGWKVIAPLANTRGYDLELQRDGHRIAVQVKNYTRKCSLAGAFALMGHDVILLDLDPDQNLHKLFRADTDDAGSEACLFVPALMKNQPGATITVLSHAQWQQSQAGDYRDAKVVICDCSPVLAENPAGLIGQFDYCIIPTTLNPLGIAKNANVITRTFAHIRSLNPRAELFCLINGYDSSKAVEKKNEVLLTHLQKEIDRYAQHDPKCRLIPPDEAKVRHSSALLYWGYHIVDGSRPQLAFREVAGRSYPRTDFLQLAEYLENHTDLATLREPRG